MISAEWTVLRDETQRHGRGHQRQDIRLDPVSESVRHDRQQPFFRYDAFERNRIAAGFFFEVTALAVSGIDEQVFRQIHDSLFSRCPPSSGVSSA